MTLYEINELMRSDKLFKVDESTSVDKETGEVFDQSYLDNLPMEQYEKSKNIGLAIKEYMADIEKIKKESARLYELKKMYENRISSLKSYVMKYGVPVNEVEVTIKFSKGRESVEVDKGIELPEEYRKYTWTANKAELSRALKDGKEIAGVRLVRNPSITVK